MEEGRAEAVIFPECVDDVVKLTRLALEFDIPLVPRGSGTSLSGGPVPAKGGVVVSFSRMNRILEIDTEDASALVEPGVLLEDLQSAVARYRYLFAPDPASQSVATIGGCVAENAGGPRCLKYGVTNNHIISLEVVLGNGAVVWLGSRTRLSPGYDLVGVFIGSEGTFGFVTKARLRLIRLPEFTVTFLVIYDSIDDASLSVSRIIASGVVPATLEMMDKFTIRAVEECFHFGYPTDADAVLIIELDGEREEVEPLIERVLEICRGCQARSVQFASTPEKRELLWRGRRGTFSALARISPTFIVMDAGVPRTRIPEALRRTYEIGEKYGLRVTNVFHAGDGNLHPNIFFEPNNPQQKECATQAAREIAVACLELGGTLSGEHGIGSEKLSLMNKLYTLEERGVMRCLKSIFDPEGIFNPCKILPDD